MSDRDFEPMLEKTGGAEMSGNPDSGVAALLRRTGAQRLPSSKADLFIIRDFLAPELCVDLIGIIDRDLRPSTIADDNGDPGFRTSKTCDLDPSHRLVAALDARLTQQLGIDPIHGEPLQGQKYEVGNEFRDHTDYFEPGGRDYQLYCAAAGQRTWTAMIYLNEPAAGGATRFRRLDKIIQPEVGKLVVWANKRADGEINPYTLHAGMKVRKGVKYVITKWYRELPWPR